MDNRGRTLTHKTWDQVEIDFLSDAYGHMTAQRIGDFLERSRASVIGMAYRLGLRKK